jgi:Putative threonine/serine exporter
MVGLSLHGLGMHCVRAAIRSRLARFLSRPLWDGHRAVDRHDLIVRKQNIFIVSSIVSFAAAFLAGSGARLLGSLHPETAMVAAVLLLVPGVAVLNIQMDAIEGKPNLAAARGLRVIYLLMFMTLGLVAAQRLILPIT